MGSLECLARSCGMAALLALSLCLAAAPEADAQTAPAAGPPAVIVAAATKRDLVPSLTFTGRIEAVDRVELRARIDGFLEARSFTEGKEVQSGQVLFVIEREQYEAEYERIQAAIKSAEAALTLAKLQLDRREQLVKSGAVSQSQVDEARAEHDESRALVQERRAELQQAELNLSYTAVFAPVSGQIGRSAYSVGNFIGPSSGVLATLVTRDPMYATFPVSQRDILAMRKLAAETGADASALTVRLRLADGSLYDQDGTINFIDVTVSPTTDTVTVRASFGNPKRLLIDGQLVTVIVEITTGEVGIFVPQQALQFDQAGHFVLTVDGDNRVKVRRITIGQGRESEIQVTSGLEEGERVIVEGVQKVRPDQQVTVSEAAGGSVSK